MNINVKLYGALRDRLPKEQKGKTVLELSEGATVADAMATLGMANAVVLAAVNEAHETEEDHVLIDGDRLTFFEMAAGG